MLLSMLTPGIAKPLTRPKEVLMGLRSATDGAPPCLSLVFIGRASYRLSLGVRWTGLLPGWPPHYWR
jgi:hypothetical protein